MRQITFVIALSVAIALQAPAQSQKSLSVWQLPSGECHEGRLLKRDRETVIVTALGELVLATPLKPVPFNAKANADLVAQAAFALHPRHVNAHVAIAQMAAASGLWGAVRKHLDAALAIDPFHVEGRAMAASLGRRFRLTDYDVPGANQSKAAEALFDDVAKTAVGVALAEGRLDDVDIALRLQFGQRFLRRGNAHQRLLAAKTLGGCLQESTRIKPLYEATLLDSAPAVRRACAKSLGLAGDPAMARVLARSLASPHQAIRLATVDAIAEMGFREGAPYLARALAGEPAVPRAHLEVTRQAAMVTDYDVEVAANAVIAKPIVTVVNEGVILDVAIISISEERVRIVTALRKLTGLDLPVDAKAWKAAVGG